MERGQIDPTLIDADANVQEHIGRIPMLQWEVEYVRKNRIGG